MRTLIDGYNLMYAAGLLGRKLGPDRFRQTRNRFLNDIAAGLGPTEATQTTVVFDAHEPPAGLPDTTTHRGLSVVYAVRDEDADSRIEELIAHHSAPKSLKVVSSDHRIGAAARRRKALALTSEAFLDQLDQTRARRAAALKHGQSPATSPAAGPRLNDREHWLAEFAHLDDDPALAQIASKDPALPDDAELAQIAQEVAREPLPRRLR